MLLFVIFASSDALDTHKTFKNVTKVAVVDEAKIFHIGEIVADIAGANHDTEEILGLDSMWLFGIGGGK